MRNNLNRILLRQQYLEILSWQGGGGQKFAFPPWQLLAVSKTEKHESVVENLLSLLNRLQPLCVPEEFNSLCQCLTLNRLDEHPSLGSWTVSQGRVQCFAEIRSALLLSDAPADPSPPALLRLLAQSLQQQLPPTYSAAGSGVLHASWDPVSRAFTVPGVPAAASAAVLQVSRPIAVQRRFDQQPPFQRAGVI
eukprot:CAMPEP_0170082430 /NCGR_PEP_ID=MMETSP0019_2-20121128/18019_1 /TAXON_ID=98059 /ORGANISM="Dinobryon sp., Strain UTEXLB2267" /LENGTH=192 /DNA_ID=CAMNT_0010297295 /DNA_START=107 /DNA_END=682 /DNA_ORIENTATION=-